MSFSTTSNKIAVIPSNAYAATVGGNHTSLFQSALSNTGSGGLVKVYPLSGGYNITGNLAVTGGRSMQGVGWPVLKFRVAGGTDCISYGPGTDDTVGVLPILENFILECGSQGQDGVRLGSGINVSMRNLIILNAGRYGLHLAPNAANNYLECNLHEFIKVHNSGSDNIRVTTALVGPQCYFNQHTFLQCSAKAGASGNAVRFVNNTSVGGDADKVSEVLFVGGLFDVRASSASDCINYSTAGGTMEYNRYDCCWIGSTSPTHSGSAVNTGGTGAVGTRACTFTGMSNNSVS